MKTTTSLALVLALAASPAVAQQAIHETKPAAKGGVVEVENVSGSVKVMGWPRAEVEVSGTLGKGTDRLEFEAGPHRTTIRVVLPHECHRCEGSELTIHVPADSDLDVETVSAPIDVTDLSGKLELKSVSGEVTVGGHPADVDARSVSGRVEVTAVDAPVHAKSVSGDVLLRGVKGDVEAGSVSGDVVVSGGAVERGEFGTTSGNIRFEGALTSAARLDAKSVSGDVELVLPSDVAADFEITSFSGDIQNAFGPAAQKVSRYTSERELSFSTGSGGARVTVKSFSGDVRLRKR
jgi:DUF4097 and DUF4098 domain-containing protein YvlB